VPDGDGVENDVSIGYGPGGGLVTFLERALCGDIAFFQPGDNKQTMTATGNAAGVIGTIDAPAAPLTESGNGALNASLIVDTITIVSHRPSRQVQCVDWQRGFRRQRD